MADRDKQKTIKMRVAGVGGVRHEGKPEDDKPAPMVMKRAGTPAADLEGDSKRKKEKRRRRLRPDAK